jgi:hypothetical protein
VHYPGHDYQPHINHVGQTDRARHLHNLPPLPPESPDYEAFRFGAEKHAPLFFECHCVCLGNSERFVRWGDVVEAGAVVRADHQMAALICVQHTTLGLNQSTSATTLNGADQIYYYYHACASTV